MTENLPHKKVLILHGSPREKGNSAILADHITTGAQEAGAVVERISLDKLNIKPCKACYKCMKKGASGCVQKDDMQSVYPKLISSPAWVFATPIYWFNMTAQTKLMLDRSLALKAYGPNPFAEKRVALAMSYQGSDPYTSGCINAIRTFQDIFNYVGADLVGMVYGTGDKPGEIEANPGLLESAEKLGRTLVAG